MFISLFFFFVFGNFTIVHIHCHVDYCRCVHLVFPSYTPVKLGRKDEKDKER